MFWMWYRLIKMLSLMPLIWGQGGEALVVVRVVRGVDHIGGFGAVGLWARVDGGEMSWCG